MAEFDPVGRRPVRKPGWLAKVLRGRSPNGSEQDAAGEGLPPAAASNTMKTPKGARLQTRDSASPDRPYNLLKDETQQFGARDGTIEGRGRWMRGNSMGGGEQVRRTNTTGHGYNLGLRRFSVSGAENGRTNGPNIGGAVSPEAEPSRAKRCWARLVLARGIIITVLLLVYEVVCLALSAVWWQPILTKRNDLPVDEGFSFSIPGHEAGDREMVLPALFEHFFSTTACIMLLVGYWLRKWNIDAKRVFVYQSSVVSMQAVAAGLSLPGLFLSPQDAVFCASLAEVNECARTTGDYYTCFDVREEFCSFLSDSLFKSRILGCVRFASMAVWAVLLSVASSNALPILLKKGVGSLHGWREGLLGCLQGRGFEGFVEDS